MFSKYDFVISLKDKKVTTSANAFNTNKIWTDQGSEFYNTHVKTWLKDNDIEMYSTHYERKSVIAERFIRTLKSKIYKLMIVISENLYFDVLNDIVDEYNNTYHRTIK